MIKARVLVPLNIRTGKPEILPDNNTGDKFYNAGDVVEINKALVGEKYKHSSIWYQLTDGAFVWSGAISKLDELRSLFEKYYPPWMVDLKIPDIWEFSEGRGVGIGIIDTGINLNNKDLEFNKAEFYLYDPTKSLQDFLGHGTHCAGLIGARNKHGKIIGVAPESDLYICKFSESGSLSDTEAIRYADAINWCINNNNIHIISISWGGRLRDDEVKMKVEDAVNKATANNKIVLCSIGDASQDNDNSKRFPACFDNAIGIGSIPVEEKLYSFLNEHLITTVDGLEINSYRHDNDDLISMSGTSQSNAIVAGIAALIIKRLGFVYTSAQIKKLLIDLSVKRQILGKQFTCLDGQKLLNFFKP